VARPRVRLDHATRAVLRRVRQFRSPYTALVCLYLVEHRPRGRKRRWPTLDDIAIALGLENRKTVGRALRELRDAGLLDYRRTVERGRYRYTMLNLSGDS
jgi:hypothetical protein